MSIGRTLLLVTCLVFGLWPAGGPSARAAAADEARTQARDTWMNGYLKIEKAVKAEEGGNPAVALQLLRDAQAVFEDVRQRFPTWNPSLVQYRINYCNERIRRLESTVTDKARDLNRTDLVSLNKQQSDKVQALTADNLELKKKLEAATSSLERARREAARTGMASDDAEKLVAENAKLQERVRVLEEQVGTLRKEAEELRTNPEASRKVKDLERDLERLTARKTELDTAFETYRRAYNNVKAQLKEASVERDKLKTENEILKEKDAQHEPVVGQWRQDLTAAREKQTGLEGEVRRLVVDLAAQKRLTVEAETKWQRLRDELAGQLNAELTAQKQLTTEAEAKLQRLRDELASQLNAELTAQKQLTTEAEAKVQRLQEELAQRPAPTAPTPEPAAKPAEPAPPVPPVQTAMAPLDMDKTLAQYKSDLDQSKAERVQRDVELGKHKAELVQRDAELGKQKAELVQRDAELGQRKAEVAQRDAELGQTRAEVAQNRTRIVELIQEVEADRTLIDSLRRKAQTKEEEATRVNGMLDALQLKAQKQESELAALKRLQADIARSEEPFQKQIESTQEELRREKTERVQLSARVEEQVTLLRRQEATVRELETARDELKGKFQQQEETIARHRQESEDLAAKAEVVEGLSATLKDSDSELAATRRKLERTIALRDQATVRLDEAEKTLKDREKEIKTYQELLAAEHSKRDEKESTALAEQVRELTGRLENERARRRALETALAQRDEQPAAAVAAPTLATVAPPDERDRRARDRQLVIRGHLSQAQSAEQKGSVETARWNYQKVLESDPTNWVALQRLGLLAAQCNDDEEAVRYLRQAFRQNPDDTEILLPLGFALVRQQKPDLAISMLTRAVALCPENAAMHRCLGVACSALGWTDAAEAQFRRALNTDAKDAEAAFNLAVLLATREPPRTDEARQWYAKAKELGSPGDPGLDATLGTGK